MNRIIISAPFGNWLRFSGTTPTLGTYTLRHRGGLLYRLWRMALTLRYNRRQQSWINRLGLPNPGIDSARQYDDRERIISIHGFNTQDWIDLANRVLERNFRPVFGWNKPPYIELNLSCPNVGHMTSIFEVEKAIEILAPRHRIIAKLPPIRWLESGKQLWRMGVRHFHLCNGISTPGGGISGKPLMQYSLWAVEEFRQKFGGDVDLIGGGGITCLSDVDRYIAAGANRVAVGSMLLNPFNWSKISKFVRHLRG